MGLSATHVATAFVAISLVAIGSLVLLTQVPEVSEDVDKTYRRLTMFHFAHLPVCCVSAIAYGEWG